MIYRAVIKSSHGPSVFRGFGLKLWISFPWIFGIFPPTPILISFKFLIHDSIKYNQVTTFLNLKVTKELMTRISRKYLYFRSVFNFLVIIQKFQSVAYVSNFMVNTVAENTQNRWKNCRDFYHGFFISKCHKG